MSIKPIDMQIMLPRTNEMSKIGTDEHSRSQMLQQQQAGQVQHKADDNIKQVHSQEKAQEAKIREKEEKNSNNKQGQDKEKRKNKGNYNASSKTEEEIKTSTIDIKI